METLRRIFIGSDGLLRPLLRAWLFFALGTYVLLPLAGDKILAWAVARLHLDVNALSAPATFAFEFELLVVVVILTALFALYERRSIDSYGLPLRSAFGSLFWEGAAVGFVWPALVAAGMLALGGMQIHGLAIAGGPLIAATLGWAVAGRFPSSGSLVSELARGDAHDASGAAASPNAREDAKRR